MTRVGVGGNGECGAAHRAAAGLGSRLCADATTTTVLAAPNPRTYDRFDERELVEAARHDVNAFAALYRRYVHRIHAYAYRRTSSPSLAEDVTSATFEKALRSLHVYRWKEPGIGPWLFRIAANELVDTYRRDNRQERTADSVLNEMRDGHRQQGPFIGQVDDSDEVRGALAKIRPRYQRALTLRYFADLTNEEVADAMNVSKATMAVILHRGTTALRRAIEASREHEVLSND